MTATSPRPVPSPEDRMRDATTPARPAMTFREARDAGLLPPAVALALPQDSEAGTDTTDRTFATYLDRTERDQLDARAGTAEQERDEALDALRDALAELKDRTAEARGARSDYEELKGINADTAQQRDDYREARDVAQQLAAVRQGINDSLRQDLSDAGDVIAAVREAAERLDRALAGRLPSLPDIRAAVEHIDRALAAYDTTPESTASPALGSLPPRAQDEPDSDARRLLDQAIDTALPLAGGRVAELLDALRRELARVDAKRAEREG